MARIMKIKKALRDQKGAVVVITAICLVVMVAMVGLAVDMGHLYSVKSELQRAADAGALAGAGALFTPVSEAPRCDPATTRASLIAQQNSADGGIPNILYAQSGRWDWNAAPGTEAFVAGCSSDPKSLTNAVRIKAQINEVPISFMGLLGTGTTNLSASSTAAMEFFDGQVQAGYGFPWAISKNCYEYNKNNTDLNHRFRLGSTYHYPEEKDSGQWTSFIDDNNSASYIKGLINNGAPAPGLSVGDSIWIQPGTEATLFGKDNAGSKINQTVIFPVVDTSDLSVKSSYKILLFVAFYITGRSQSKKYLEGYFSPNYVLPNSKPRNPNSNIPYFNILTPPRLVY
jgi:hypothetical protein